MIVVIDNLLVIFITIYQRIRLHKYRNLILLSDSTILVTENMKHMYKNIIK